MPPRPRPLKLPLSAFAPPSAESRPAEPAASKVTIDAHADLATLPEGALDFSSWKSDGRNITGAIGVVRADTMASSSGVLRTIPILPIPLPSKLSPLPQSEHLEFEVVLPANSDSTFAEIERVLDDVGGLAREVGIIPGEDVPMALDGARGADSEGAQRTVVISGILPPPLDPAVSPAMMIHQMSYQLYSQQISALSLIPGLCLKLLPPSVLEATDSSSVGWWEDEEALIRAISNYLIPALDSFGSHRLIFGASPSPLIGVESSSALFNPRRDWHELLLKVFKSIKLDQVSVGEIMGGTATRVYGLGEDSTS